MGGEELYCSAERTAVRTPHSLPSHFIFFALHVQPLATRGAAAPQAPPLPVSLSAHSSVQLKLASAHWLTEKKKSSVPVDNLT